MNVFDLIITKPITWIIELCYKIIPNYAVAIILFTIIIKALLFPFSIWSQIMSVKMAKIKPQLDDIKAYHSDSVKMIFSEQKKLYKKEHYNSFVSLVPLILQIPIIIGVIRCMNQSGILSALPGVKMMWLPILSGLSAFGLCYVQNLCNVLAKEMRFLAKWGFAIFLTAFSLYFAFTSGVGFGVYWTAGNVIAIGVQLLCNLIYNPKKYVTYDILPPAKKDWALLKRQREKQKADMKRFYAANKKLVFYSEKSGFYKYFQGTIDYILKNSNIKIHYLTSDIDDQVFRIDNPRFIPYYCGAKKLITVLMKLECRVCVMTMPDLEKYQYKRSIVNKNIEYIYMDHGFSSLTMVARKQAFDYFDTIFTYGKNVDKEIRAMEKFYGSKEKNLVGTGYDLFYKLEKNYVPVVNEKKTVILASSWQKDNIMESCLDDLVQSFEKLGYKVIIRPHPEFIKRFPQKIQKIKSKFPNELQLDFSVNIMNADVLVTDWSSIGWEFTYATNKPCIFINTPIKALNPDWDKYGIEPLEIFVRDKIGTAVDIADIKDMGAKIKAIEKITNPRKVIKDIMYDNSKANEIGGKYIIDAVKKERQ